MIAHAKHQDVVLFAGEVDFAVSGDGGGLEGSADFQADGFVDGRAGGGFVGAEAST